MCISLDAPLLQSCISDDPTALGNLIKLLFRFELDLNVSAASSGMEEWTRLFNCSSQHVGRRKMSSFHQTVPQQMDEALFCGKVI